MKWRARVDPLRAVLLQHAGLLALLVVVWAAGLLGADFGHHWDEPLETDQLLAAVDRGALLPNRYNYPSVTYWLGLLTALPAFVQHSFWPALRMQPENPQLLKDFLTSHGFLLAMRRCFILLSSLTVAWTYLWVWTWQRRRGVAWLAAAFVGLSWEIAYHSRWIAPDMVMCQFAVLTLWCLEMARTHRDRRWLARAAIAAGLAAGSKYPGGALLLPIALTAWIVAPTARARTAAVASSAAIFFATFLLSTPGAVLEYRRFFADVAFEYAHYHERGHGAYTIAAGWPHLRAALEFLALSALSSRAWVAGALTACAVLGALATLRADRQRAVVLLAFPVFYLGYMSQQRVLIVRNLLVLIPFLGVFAAIGVQAVGAKLPQSGRRLAALGLAVLIAAQAGFLLWTGLSIAYPTPPADQARAWLLDHPNERTAATAHAREALQAAGARLPPNVVPNDRPGELPVLFFAEEALDERYLNGTHGDFALRVFGNGEVNYNFYPSWQGTDRLVMVDAARGRDMHLPP